MKNRFTDAANRASRKVSGEPVYTQREIDELLQAILDRMAYDHDADPDNIVRAEFAKLGVRP